MDTSKDRAQARISLRGREDSSARGTIPELNNSDLFLYSLYRLGGGERFVDIEDVFVDMWRRAPQRFGWRKYEYPNYKVAYVAISDLTGRETHQDELLLRSTDGLSRQLTAAGVRWVESRRDSLDAAQDELGPTPRDRRPAHRTLVELERHQAVRRFLDGDSPDLSDNDVATMLRCAPDSPQEVRQQRLETLRSRAQAAHRDGLSRFLEWLAQQRADWFRRR